MAGISSHVHKDFRPERPWKNAKPEKDRLIGDDREIKQSDTKESIECCMACKLPVEVCNGSGFCYTSDGKPKRSAKAQYDEKKLIELIGDGLQTKEIAYEMHVTSATVSEWKKRLRNRNKKENETG